MHLKHSIVYFPEKRNDKPVKYLCICAHQDDNEIMAMDGVLKGYNSKDCSFALVVTSDGGGSARTGAFKDYTDEMMKQIRIKEQKEASEIGHYHSLYLLGYPSSDIKDRKNYSIVDDFIEIIKELKPEVIYTHSLLDKHPTHIGVALKVILALRILSKDEQPKVLYGCEVWRGLDWISDQKKIGFDLSEDEQLQIDILNVFKSQIEGGKSYTEATIGRRYANATYYQSHSVDSHKLVSYGIDMTELIKNPFVSPKDFALSFVEDLRKDVEELL